MELARIVNLAEAKTPSQRTLGNLLRFFEPWEDTPAYLEQYLMASYCYTENEWDEAEGQMRPDQAVELYKLNDRYVASHDTKAPKSITQDSRQPLEWLAILVNCRKNSPHELNDHVVAGQMKKGPTGLIHQWIDTEKALNHLLTTVEVYIKPKEPKRVF